MAKRKEQSIAHKIIIQQSQITRKDVGDWQDALRQATRTACPKFFKLQDLYTHIMRDIFLSSQIALRIQKTIGNDYALLDDNDVPNDDATKRIRELPVFRELMNLCLESLFYGISLVEIKPTNDSKVFTLDLINRGHIDPFNGVIYLDKSDYEGIRYRELREYGTSLIEFSGTSPATPNNFGILNECVVDALFMRFAKSCWSELCEIYGMPPRYIKTNIQDPDIRNMYKQMLQDVGAGANYVIDTDDEIGFANTNSTDGSLYAGLIFVCKEEISIRINGAMLGQDTKFGSNSKEKTSSELQDEIIDDDKLFLSANINSTILPLLERYGIIPSGLHFGFIEQEDNSKLFDQTMRAAAYFDIDPKWVKDKFGIEVLGFKSFEQGNNLSALQQAKDISDFFV